MKGFTLVELLVSLAAMTILATAAASLTLYASGSRDAIAERAGEQRDLMRLRAALKADVTQAAPRRARTQAGEKPQGALQGEDRAGDGPFLALVRRGWSNPHAEPRPSMQVVEYWLEDGAVTRRHRRNLDGGALGQPQRLMEGVSAVDVSFFDRDQWIETWTGSPLRPFPRALRLRMTIEGAGEVSQLFLLPETGS